MPTFTTPEPVTVTVGVISGDARIIASERGDTIVHVRPHDKLNPVDVEAAEAVRVEHSDGRITVKPPKRLQSFFTSRTGTIDVTIELPTGSHVRINTAHGDLVGEGKLGHCMLRTAHGDISLEEAATVGLTTLHGQVTVGRIALEGKVVGSGEVRIREINGRASVQNLNGDSWIGQITGDVAVNSAHGNIFVDHAGASVTARTAFGDVRIGDISRGKATLQSATGELEIGIREGTAAWLQLKSTSGRVLNSLVAADRPEESVDTVEIRARTFDGNILIRRAATTR